MLFKLRIRRRFLGFFRKIKTISDFMLVEKKTFKNSMCTTTEKLRAVLSRSVLERKVKKHCSWNHSTVKTIERPVAFSNMRNEKHGQSHVHDAKLHNSLHVRHLQVSFICFVVRLFIRLIIVQYNILFWQYEGVCNRRWQHSSELPILHVLKACWQRDKRHMTLPFRHAFV